jgi:phosphomannomutase
MRSVSGLRGIVGVDLVPEVVERYAGAFGALVRDRGGREVALARDSRQSGPALAEAVSRGLRSAGVDVVDLGMVPTPTAQIAVERLGMAAGIVVTASHNPIEWNALKFIGSGGRFLNREEAAALYALVDGGKGAASVRVPPGEVRADATAVQRHLDLILGLPWLDVEAIRRRRFRVALDCVRGAGATIMPALLERLGCRVSAIHLEPDGLFPREPEPVPENLGELSAHVHETHAELGIAVDPDVDRLAVVDETGRPIGEDYTLAFAVRATLARRRGPVVTNLSTSLVVDDAARPFGVEVRRAPVGEANVVEMMRETGAVIGGEGNGGVILPEVHLGRDAPVAAALVLALLAERGRVSEVVNSAPRYAIVKAKIDRPAGAIGDPYARLGTLLAGASEDRRDGLRLALEDRWVHVRPSGTEPVVRLIAEAPTEAEARELVARARALLTD